MGDDRDSRCFGFLFSSFFRVRTGNSNGSNSSATKEHKESNYSEQAVKYIPTLQAVKYLAKLEQCDQVAVCLS